MLRQLIRALRPLQWAKNILVFAPLAFDLKLFDPFYLSRTVLAFLALSALASSVYLLNDLADIEKDRLHPTKRNRPLASGQLPIPLAIVTLVVLAAAGLLTSWWLGVWVFALALFYIVKNLAYSYYLKRIVIIDVMLLALNYLIRVGMGVVVVEVERFSPWLYVCVGLGALFIGLGKRRHELVLMQRSGDNTRDVLNHYTLPFIDLMMAIVATSTITAYAFYTFSDAPTLPTNHVAMLTIPIVIYGIFRYLYLIHVRGQGGAPDELVFEDRPLFATVVIWGLTMVTLLYFF